MIKAQELLHSLRCMLQVSTEPGVPVAGAAGEEADGGVQLRGGEQPRARVWPGPVSAETSAPPPAPAATLERCRWSGQYSVASVANI